MMARGQDGKDATDQAASGGLAVWLLNRLKLTRRPQARLALIERIALAPRQSLALVEAEGRRFLVATSPEGAPAFYALDGDMRGSRADIHGTPERRRSPLPRPVTHGSSDRPARVSW